MIVSVVAVVSVVDVAVAGVVAALGLFEFVIHCSWQ